MVSEYPSKAVANWFLDKFRHARRDCTQLHLNKIVFIAHGWHFAYDPDQLGLINEPVVAWKFGPVVPSLRREFLDMGSKPIRSRASEWDIEGGTFEPDMADFEVQVWEMKLLDWVWHKYGHLSGPELVARTHRPGTPWATVTRNGTEIGHNRVIPPDVIQAYYMKLRNQIESRPELKDQGFHFDS